MTMKFTKALTVAALALAGVVYASPALADTLDLSFTNPSLTGSAGETLTFNATALAPSSNAAPVYLNGDNITFSLPAATTDDSPFLFNFPFSLNPGDSFTGDVFTLPLSSTLAPGIYTGSFEILGGSDGSAYEVLSSTNFQASVIAATPEPDSLLLFGIGVALLAVYTRRRSRA
jgi:hypothetical protein